MIHPAQITIGQPCFFFDNELIERTTALTRHWFAADVDPDPALAPTEPWENGNLMLHGSVLPVPGGGWRMYHSTFGGARYLDGASGILLAESRDGLRWEKVMSNRVHTATGQPTNLVFDPAGRHLDSAVVVRDHADPASPWKMVCFDASAPGDAADPTWGLHGFVSHDGLEWTELPDRLVRMGDRCSLVRRPADGKWLLYSRYPDFWPLTGGRHLALATSADFRTWSDPELVLGPDLEDGPDIQFYGMPVFFRHGWFFGLLEYWDAARDIITVHLALSRDGVNWRRPWRHPFVGGELPWNSRWSTCANSDPLEFGDRLVFYFGGRNRAHDWDAVHIHGVIGRATLPIDRFCALEGRAGGTLVTRVLEWPGGELVVNADTRTSFSSHPGHVDGELRVEVLDASEAPIPALKTGLFKGNTHCRGRVHDGRVKSESGQPLRIPPGPIRLRFTLRSARLYTIQAGPSVDT